MSGFVLVRDAGEVSVSVLTLMGFHIDGIAIAVAKIPERMSQRAAPSAADGH